MNTEATAGTRPSLLLRERRFLPYFITQFFGAFNDNIFKNVLLIFVAFAASGTLPISSNLFINLAAGLFILPFFLFSATAGELADKYDKDWFIRKVKMAEIGIMLLGAIGFITQSYLILLLLLFLMGTQSAFFGPVKYSLLPHHLNDNELVTGNAVVETGTFLAILLGTLGAGVIASSDSATNMAASTVIFCAIAGYLASRYIPNTPTKAPGAKVRWQPVSQTRKTLSIGKQDKMIYQAIIAISWFWFLGATYLTQFPNFTRIHLSGNESAVSFLLALFSVGIAAGSLLCEKLSRNRIELGLVTLGSLGITLFGVLLVALIPDNLPKFETFSEFIGSPTLWPVFLSLAFLGASGGLYIVPLYTIMQQRSDEKQRSQVIAANNIYNSLFMVGSALLGMLCLGVLEISIPSLFMLIAVLNLCMTLFLSHQTPAYFTRFIVWILTHTLMYRVKHKNLHHIPKHGSALIVCNHVSYMDALLLSAVCPRLIRFVMEEDYANYRPIRRFLKRAGVIPIDGTNRKSITRAFREIETALSEGHLVCIFPEGQLTSDGEVHEFMRGIDIILKRSPVPVIPFALKGLWGSYFSRYKGRACKGLPKRFRAELEIEAGAPIPAQQASSQLLREKVIGLRGDLK